VQTLDQHGRPLRDLRISVTDRCNFRCGYCMPSEAFPDDAKFLAPAELLTFDEIERLARLFVEQLGVRKLRITGGEPLLRPDLPQLVSRLAALPQVQDVALTTNGYTLAAHAHDLSRAGLTRVTVSLDSLDPDEFARMSGRPRDLERVLAGIDAACAAGLAPLKLNCVVIRGRNERALLTLAARFRGTPHVLRFIEYMDVGTQNDWRRSQVVSAQEIREIIGAQWPIEPLGATHAGEAARRYRYLDGAGEIGVVASVTEPFCGTCNRARISADGRLLMCLFAATGEDLRRAVRSGVGDAELAALLHGAWRTRSDRYSEERHARASGNVRRRLEMYQVGG
jgi:GTP 3',8-cyclase